MNAKHSYDVFKDKESVRKWEMLTELYFVKKQNNTSPAKVNPFIKMIEDKKRIVDAIRAGQDLSKLKDIKFVTPL
ncbi:hypothetical protein [Pedobacter africanus]|uniref:Uncharacterized protein n=1 Tax=Pedobacter africanus TaxID=151894 RepID=A0A1W2CS70_9SPHI|nr:hypothetical protein [Pedobacter africanus]SMC87528.1 hypothetical protein SAMN04488524_3099 [Pedobacter africanus]